ncbi:glutaminyl-peptide cyclotransferase-like [Eurosta solidaginis]|uniref:glutaminyl-peptide cyclotransferase-like n=1 Tax=Eurosta solidaginis TaxID=178769 RepID=UPI0035315152
MACSLYFITFFVLIISVCVKQYLCVYYPVGLGCQKMYPVKELSKEELLKYGKREAVNHFGDAVKNILIPRVVGKDGHTRVRNYISDSLDQMGWSVEYDAFNAKVRILGKVRFQNIIAKLNPKAKRFLVLTCHYDSRYSKSNTLLGALDAVPCAMLLNMAYVLQDALEPFRRTKLSLMFIFFDGREPPEKGVETDFPYGARHLAKSWEQDGTLNKLHILVVLDMIGLAGTTFHSFFKNTEAWFSRFTALEERLSNASLLYRCRKPKFYFETDPINDHYFEGDHMPFLEQDLPILLLTPKIHPREWHTEEDNKSIIAYGATEDISRIIRLFIMEYLLSGVKK